MDGWVSWVCLIAASRLASSSLPSPGLLQIASVTDHLVQDDVGLVERGLHHLVLGGEVAHHVDVLRALAGEQQADLGLVRAGLEGVDALQLELQRRLGPGLRLAVLGHELYLFLQVLRGLGDYRHAPRALGLRHRRLGVGRKRVGFRPLAEDGGGFFLRVIDHVLGRIAGEGHGLALQAGERRARVFHHLHGGGGGLGGGAGLDVARVAGAGVLLQQHVEVGAAEAERRDVGAAHAAGVPGLGLGDDLEEVLVYAGVELHAVDGGRQRLVVDGERGLGHGHRAGGGLGVADLGLHGGQAELLAPAHVRAEHFLQHLHLGGVADLGGGAVGFHEIHLARAVVHLFEGVLDGYLLAFRVGRGDALALAVGGGADRVDQRVDLVAVAHGVRQALQDVNGDRLGHHEAVGPLVEGVGAVGRQRAYLAELHEGGGAHHLVGAAGHGHVELAGPQAQHRVVERGHGGGAGRVHRHVGAVEVENVGDAAGRHVGQLAGHRVLGDLDDAVVYAGLEFRYQGLLLVLRQRGEDGGLLYQVLVVELVDAQVGHLLAVGAHRVAEHGRGALVVERLLIVAGVLERHADGLDGHLLQARDLRRALRGYLVLDGIEFEPFYEAAYLGIGLVHGLVVLGIVEPPVPAVGRHLAYAVLPLQHVLPELVLVEGLGSYDAETDYRYFFIVHNLYASLRRSPGLADSLRYVFKLYG